MLLPTCSRQTWMEAQIALYRDKDAGVIEALYQEFVNRIDNLTEDEAYDLFLECGFSDREAEEISQRRLIEQFRAALESEDPVRLLITHCVACCQLSRGMPIPIAGLLTMSLVSTIARGFFEKWHNRFYGLQKAA